MQERAIDAGANLAGGILIRQATAADTEEMLRLTQTVWDGNDYLPFVWNQWLHDATGRLTVALMEGRLAGIHHIAQLPDGTAWAEGIRVAEDLRGRGIGEALLIDAIEWSQRMGLGAVRLSTTDANPASNRVVEKCGLVAIRAFDLWSAPATAEGERCGIRVLQPQDTAEVWNFLQANAGWSGRSLFYTEGWTAYMLTPERLRLLLATSSVAVAGNRGIGAVAIATATQRRPTLRLGLLLGDADGVEQLGAWLRRRAGESGLESVRGPLLTGPGESVALERAGYERDPEHRMILHERRLVVS